MSDNTQLGSSVGTGDVVATDDIGGVKYPRGKIITGIDGVNDGDVAKTNPFPVAQYPVTYAASVGLSTAHLVSANSTNPTIIKASAGQLYGVHLSNSGSSWVYVKFHNTAGVPTAGAGVVLTVGCQAGLRADVTFPAGRPFSTGIGMTIVTGITDASAVAVALNHCVVDVEYK